MKFKIQLILIVLAAAGCSSSVVKEEPRLSAINKTELNKKLALEKFINGSALELKGQINEAIAEYLDALKFDSSPGIFYALAKNYYRVNKLSSALGYSQKAINKEPDNTEYLMLQASIYTSSHLEDSAAVVFKRVIKLDSVNANAYFGLAQLYENKKPSEAIAMYKKVIELTGPEWNVLVKIADINERLGNISETISTVEELIRLSPSDLNLQKLLIESYLKTKNHKKALENVDQALISYPDDPVLIDLKGRIYVAQSKWKDASDIYMRLIKNPSINYEAKLRIGTSFLGESEKDSVNLDLAKKIFIEMKRDTLDWQVNAYLGEIELKQKNDNAAIEYFKTAAKISEWNAAIWTRLGGILFDARKYDECISYMKTAVDKFPNDLTINLIYGLSLSALNKHQDAKHALEKTLKINPNDVNALSAIGYTYNQMKNDNEAIIYLNRALIYDPKNLQAISVLALIHESRKDFHISDSLYTNALKIDSTNALLLNNFAYSLAERNVRLNEALMMAQKAIKQEAQNSSYLDTIGWIYFRLGDFEKAKLNIQKAVQIETTNATLLDHLGDVYFKLGDKSKAVDYWKKAFNEDSTKTEIKTKIDKGGL